MDTDEEQRLSSNSGLSAQYDTFHQRPNADDLILLDDEEEKSPGERIIPNLFGQSLHIEKVNYNSGLNFYKSNVGNKSYEEFNYTPIAVAMRSSLVDKHANSDAHQPSMLDGKQARKNSENIYESPGDIDKF